MSNRRYSVQMTRDELDEYHNHQKAVLLLKQEVKRWRDRHASAVERLKESDRANWSLRRTAETVESLTAEKNRAENRLTAAWLIFDNHSDNPEECVRRLGSVLAEGSNGQASPMQRWMGDVYRDYKRVRSRLAGVKGIYERPSDDPQQKKLLDRLLREPIPDPIPRFEDHASQ